MKLYNPSEKAVLIKVEQRGRVIVATAVNESGERHSQGQLFSLRNGVLYLALCVGEDLGFQLDDQGRIKVAKG